MVRASTDNRYHARIQRVVDALLAAPAAEHSVASLAAMAHMSEFHFLRVYRAIMGESLQRTLRRLRLGLAADRLVECDDPVQHIAEAAGYESPQAFARAFRSFAQATPSEFRRQHRRTRFPAHPNIPVGDEFAAHIDVVCQLPCTVLATPHVGPIRTIPDTARRFWQWQLRHGLVARVEQHIGVVYPDATTAQGFHYFSSVLVDVGDRRFDDATVLTLPGGQYARFRLNGPGYLVAAAFRAMASEWLPRSGFELDDRPLLEMYRDQYWLQCGADGPVTDLYMPIRSPTTGSAQCAAGLL